MTTDSLRRIVRWLPLMVIAAGIVVYVNSMTAPFIFDDMDAIGRNVDIRHILPIALSPRMIVALTFKLNYAMGGLNVADYHAVNLVIHIMAGMFLYGLVRRTLKLPSLADKYGRSAPWLAVSIAVIWVVHPLQTESVTYICQRYESMMGLFFIMSMYCFARGVGAGRSKPWFIASVLACSFGTGTKAVIVGVPVVALLYDYVFVATSFRELVRARWKVHVCLFGTWGLLFYLQMVSVGKALADGVSVFSHVSPREYLFTQFGVIVHYLRLSVFPDPLCLDYTWPVASGLWEIILPGLLLGVLGVGSLWALVRRVPVGFLGACFFILLAPTSSVLPIKDMAFEHRMYLALSVPVVLCVIGGYRLTAMLAKPRIVRWTLVTGIVLVLGLLSIRRNEDYGSEVRMWRDVLAKRPRNVRVRVNLASYLLGQGHFKEAAQHARDVLALLPELTNGGGKYGETVYRGSSHAENILGIECLENEDFVDAIAHFDRAIALLPGYIPPHANKALAYRRQGDNVKAVEQWKIVLVAAPDNANALNGLGLIQIDRGEYAAGKANLERAVAVEAHFTARRALAWLLATCPDGAVRDGEKAVVHATVVCNQTGYRSFKALDALAAGHAECRRFDQAGRLARVALKLLEGSSVAIESEKRLETVAIEARIRLYDSGQPFREADVGQGAEK